MSIFSIGIQILLQDYYYELAVSSNTSVARVEIVHQNCFPKFGYIQGGDVVQSSEGVFNFMDLHVACYPEGNVTLLVSAVVSDVASIGLNAMDFPIPEAHIEVSFRGCVAGEVIDDASCLECAEGYYLLKYESSKQSCAVCAGEAERCFANQIILQPGYFLYFSTKVAF